MNNRFSLPRLGMLLSLSMYCSATFGQKATDPATGETHKDLEKLAFTVEAAPEWTELFKRTSGWFGADGAYSIPLNGKESKRGRAGTKTMLLFSDSVIGEIEDGKLDSTYSFINNSIAYLMGIVPRKDKISFHWDQTKEGKPTALFVPNTPSAQHNDYYWLGDGFVNTAKNNDTYIFGFRMRNVGDKEWGFKNVGSTLIILPAGSKPPFKDQRQIETPFYFDAEDATEIGAFGAGIFVNTKAAGVPDPDGYVYVYGVKGSARDLLVARVLPETIEDFSAWHFWDGKSWSKDMRAATPVIQGVSHELSLSPLSDGRYALVFQAEGVSSKVGLRLGATPYGPFGSLKEIWDAREVQRKNYVVYNAKAHPHLSAPGELLISYNVNAFDFLNEIKANPHLYRPTFLRLKFGERG